MPGAVLRVHAAVGAAVAAGDPVVTLEAMKMEHVVVAPIAGRIADLRVRAADQVVARPAPRRRRALTGPLRVRSASFPPEVPMAHHETATGPQPTRCRRRATSCSRSIARRARRRNAAAHGSQEHVAAIDLLGRIEVEVARIERAMDPPLV